APPGGFSRTIPASSEGTNGEIVGARGARCGDHCDAHTVADDQGRSRREGDTQRAAPVAGVTRRDTPPGDRNRPGDPRGGHLALLGDIRVVPHASGPARHPTSSTEFTTSVH